MDIKRGQIPLARLFLPFACGIAFALHHSGNKTFLYIALALFILTLAYYLYNNKHDTGYKNRWIFGTLIAAFLFCTGYSFTFLNTPTERTSDISNHLQDDPHTFLISIISSPKEKDKSVKAVGEVKGIINHGQLLKTTGKIMVSFQKDTIGDTIRYGDLLVVHTQLNPVKPPMNPDEFDYKHYLELNGIYYEAFVPKHSFSNTGKSDVSWLLRFTDRCRHKLIDLLNDKIKGNEAAVGSAILLGYRNDLSPSVIEEFTDSGTVHVICVAGLHVGILFWMLNLLLFFFDRFKHGKIIRTILLLVLLWLYALFTGMATPVIRATVMFSFLLVGRQFSRYTNSINTLAASALLMLLINPFSLADTGFQLSYLSVLGILTIYPILNGLFEPRLIVIRKIWELACLSGSAQLSIVPLSLLYFHQFPNYFILTNILVVPLLSIVIYAGILFFITSHIPFVSTLVTWIFHKSLLLMNLLVGQSNHLPLYVTKGIFIYPLEVVLLFAFILGLFIFHHNRKYSTLVISLSVFTLFLGARIYQNIFHSKQQLFVVYHVYKHSSAAFISGRQSVMPFSNIDSSDFKYHLQYHFWEKGIRDTISIKRDTSLILLSGHLAARNNFIQFNGKRFAFIRNDDDVPDSLQKFPVHCIVVSAAYKMGMEALQNAFTFDTLIFDSSIAPSRLKKWKKQCDELHIKYYDVGKQGAYIENV
ncbi:MAG TPA: ComEC/Rec2 family competence protein [Bacteroidia bacterium]|nr:ComEC/Rec2 family competence protein [Bacteroidia bacterium]